MRIRKANILGYESSAAFTLSNKMAATPETVDNFLQGIMDAAVAKAKEELADKLTGTIVKEIYVPGRIVNIVQK